MATNHITEQIILTAATWAGRPPVNDADSTATAGWYANVGDHAAELAKLVNANGRIAQTVNGLASARRLVCTITDVYKEDRSTRAVVTIDGPVTEHCKDGVDQIRTERTDRSRRDLDFARSLYRLRGRKVMLWIEVEKPDGPDSKGYRVIRDVDVLDHAPDAPSTPPPTAPAANPASGPVTSATVPPSETFSAENGAGTDPPPTNRVDGHAQPEPVNAQPTVTDF